MEAKVIKTARPDSAGGKRIAAVVLPVAAELLLVAFLGLMYQYMTAGADVRLFMNGLQGLAVLGTMVFVLLITGLLRSFFEAFVYGFGRADGIEKVHLAKCRVSVQAAAVSAVLGGLLGTIVCAIDILSRSSLEGSEYLDWFFSVALSGCLYGILVALLLLPVSARLKVKTLKYD